MKSSYFKIISIILISSLGIIVYSNSFHCTFQFDDHPSIVNNFAIRNIGDLQSIWNFLPRRFILYLSIALNYSLNGLQVFGYHLFNLGVHLFTAILVWWFVLLTLATPAMNEASAEKNAIGKRSSHKQKKDAITAHADLKRPNCKLLRVSGMRTFNLEKSSFLALLAGLIFVSHPLQTEAVTYIVQRAASMATLFYMAALCFYIKSRTLQDKIPNTTAGRVYYVGAIITTILAMFTKETAITIPFIILLYEFSFFKTKKVFKWGYCLPFLLTLLIIPLIMLMTETGASRLHELRIEPGISSTHYLLTQFRVIVTYIRLAFIPINQNLNYSYPVSQNFFELPTLFSFLFLILILYCAKLLFSKYRLISFSLFWFFLTLLPESSILPIKDVIFEHRLYLPMVGYSLFLVSCLYYVAGKRSLKLVIIFLSLIIACNSILTYQRNKIWRTEFTLWSDNVKKSPDNAKSYSNRGNEYYLQGNLTQAMSDFNRALEINPHYAEAYNGRGLIFAQQGDLTKAIADYTKAIEIHPTFAEAYNNLGSIYGNHGDLIKAIADFNKAIEINPNYAGSYGNRGFALNKQGHFIEAISDYTKAIELDPKDARDYNNRGLIYFQQKNPSRAIADFSKAIEISPDDTESYNNRCSVYGSQGNLEQSISDCDNALKLNPQYAPSYNNLTITYYRLKEYAKAWGYAQKAKAFGYAVDPSLLNAIKNALRPEN